MTTTYKFPSQVAADTANRICLNLGGQIPAEPFLHNIHDTFSWAQQILPYVGELWTPFRKKKRENSFYDVNTLETVEIYNWVSSPSYAEDCVIGAELSSIGGKNGLIDTNCNGFLHKVLCQVESSPAFWIIGIDPESNFATWFKPVNMPGRFLWAGANGAVITYDWKDEVWIGKSSAAELFVNGTFSTLMLGV